MDKLNWLDECRAACRRIKYVAQHIEWTERPNHTGWLAGTSALLDENRVSIPTLYIKGEYQPARLGDRITYGLMYRHLKDHHRVFMIEVYPPHVRSHVEPGKILFGPHLHLGDERLRQITRGIRTTIDQPFAPRWVDRFSRHANIRANGGMMIVPPFTDDLFRIEI